MLICQTREIAIVGVYMPHYTGIASQIDRYSQTVEDIQYIIDSNNHSSGLLLNDINHSVP